eukprot:GHVU01196260.1.p1 GENE.GHVU01196260.1~~GHVU01196260.1.p1  ORF type:complete len:114 (+),score=2.02 GHVU01196260.1:7-348(+)
MNELIDSFLMIPLIHSNNRTYRITRPAGSVSCPSARKPGEATNEYECECIHAREERSDGSHRDPCASSFFPFNACCCFCLPFPPLGVYAPPGLIIGLILSFANPTGLCTSYAK